MLKERQKTSISEVIPNFWGVVFAQKWDSETLLIDLGAIPVELLIRFESTERHVMVQGIVQRLVLLFETSKCCNRRTGRGALGTKSIRSDWTMCFSNPLQEYKVESLSVTCDISFLLKKSLCPTWTCSSVHCRCCLSFRIFACLCDSQLQCCRTANGKMWR